MGKQMKAENKMSQRDIHQLMIVKGLITPARKRFQVSSPPLKLEGKPLSQYLGRELRNYG